ncbi:MAG: hypothetical protein JXR63_08405 [Spirochaetales bacterium]|nr:hypothetical protein [Spirochaetales bacterium]
MRNRILLSGLYLVSFISLFFSGWKWNIPIASWIALFGFFSYILLEKKWYFILLAQISFVIPFFVQLHGSWDMSVGFTTLVAALRVLPFSAVSIFLAAMPRKASWFWLSSGAGLCFALCEYAIAAFPQGTTMFFSYSQFPFKEFIQVSSIIGSSGLTYLMVLLSCLAAFTFARVYEKKDYLKPLVVTAGIFALLLVYGSFRYHLAGRSGETIKVAGVTVAHEYDFWDIIDRGTGQEFLVETQELRDRLFQNLIDSSSQASAAGAEVIFWSEGAAAISVDEYEDSLARLGEFAAQNNLFFVASLLVLHPDSNYGSNEFVVFDADGELLFRYEKAYSWYATKSDKKIHFFNTKKAKIGSIICFDLDFPRYVRDVATAGADLLLVPGYDTRDSSPYHTYQGLFRGVEFGFSIFRHANESLSAVSDAFGRVYATQDFFSVENPVLIADVPIFRKLTVYRYIQPYLLPIALILLVVSILVGIFTGKKC